MIYIILLLYFHILLLYFHILLLYFHILLLYFHILQLYFHILLFYFRGSSGKFSPRSAMAASNLSSISTLLSYMVVAATARRMFSACSMADLCVIQSVILFNMTLKLYYYEVGWGGSQDIYFLKHYFITIRLQFYNYLKSFHNREYFRMFYWSIKLYSRVL